MRTYKVWMKGMDEKSIEVQADDVELDCVGECGDTAFWNFLRRAEEEDDVTVAAFPFEQVVFISSQA